MQVFKRMLLAQLVRLERGNRDSGINFIIKELRAELKE